ncbi:MAG: hypothetical protein RRY15_07285 [Bacteroidales bacterium]
MYKINSYLRVIALIITMVLFGSCQKEVEAFYSFGVSTLDVHSDNGPIAALVVLKYLEDNQYVKIEYYDNNAKSMEEAIKKNDAQAIREFDAKVKILKLVNFKQLCIQSGCKNVSGSFTYALSRDENKNLVEYIVSLD